MTQHYLTPGAPAQTMNACEVHSGDLSGALPYADSEFDYVVFQVAGIYRDRPKRLFWLYTPLVWLIRLIGWFTPPRSARKGGQIHCNPPPFSRAEIR